MGDKRPCPVPGYQVELLDNEFLLFHPNNRVIFRSNGTGALIWELCDGERTITEIITLLRTNYPQAASQIPQDVLNTLQTFAQHGAIQWR